MDEILDEVARLRIQVSENTRLGDSYMINRYLDSLSTYAESVSHGDAEDTKWITSDDETSSSDSDESDQEGENKEEPPANEAQRALCPELSSGEDSADMSRKAKAKGNEEKKPKNTVEDILGSGEQGPGGGGAEHEAWLKVVKEVNREEKNKPYAERYLLGHEKKTKKKQQHNRKKKSQDRNNGARTELLSFFWATRTTTNERDRSERQRKSQKASRRADQNGKTTDTLGDDADTVHRARNYIDMAALLFPVRQKNRSRAVSMMLRPTYSPRPGLSLRHARQMFSPNHPVHLVRAVASNWNLLWPIFISPRLGQPLRRIRQTFSPVRPVSPVTVTSCNLLRPPPSPGS